MTITTRIKEKLDNYRTCVLMAIDFLSKDQLEEAGVRFRKSAEAYLKIILYEQMGDETGQRYLTGEEDAGGNPLSPWLKPSYTQMLDTCYSKGWIDVNIHRLLDDIRKKSNENAHDPNEPINQTLLKQKIEDCLKLSQKLSTLIYKHVGYSAPAEMLQAYHDGVVDYKTIVSLQESDMDTFVENVDFFDKSNRYILVAPFSTDALSETLLHNLMGVRWSMIIDFNCHSKENGGLYHSMMPEIDDNCTPFTILNREGLSNMSKGTNGNVNWIFANGLANINGTVTPDIATWIGKRMHHFLKEALAEFCKKSLSCIHIISLLDNEEYLEEVIHQFDGIDFAERDLVSFSIISDKQHVRDNMAKLSRYGFDIHCFSFSLVRFVSEIGDLLRPEDRSAIIVPGRNAQNEPISIDITGIYSKLLANGINVVHRDIVSEADKSIDPLPAFYRGETITWKELEADVDVQRGRYEELKRKVLERLNGRVSQKFTLYHSAGAGGTTISRRLAYDLREQVPTIIINDYSRTVTFSLIELLSVKLNRPMLAIVESSKVGNIDELIASCNAKKRIVVFVYVERILNNRSVVGQPQSECISDRMYDAEEKGKFTYKVNLYRPNSQCLQWIEKTPYANCEVIDFSMSIAEDEYRKDAIDRYVRQYLNQLSEPTVEFLTYVSMVYHYAQRSVSDLVFRKLFVTSNGKTGLMAYMRQRQDEMLYLKKLITIDGEDVEEERLWRPRYSRFADIVLEQVLGGDTPDKWKNALPEWSKKLIRVVKENYEFLTDDVQRMLVAVFLEREKEDLLGHEEAWGARGAQEKFSQLLDDMAFSMEDQKDILKLLAEKYPNVSHFWGHLARFCYENANTPDEFHEAISYIETALDRSGGNDYNLLHIAGMCHRRMIEYYQRTKVDIGREELKNITKIARDYFGKSRNVNPRNVHAYTSEIQLLTVVIEYGKGFSNHDTYNSFLLSPGNTWFFELYEDLNDLIEELTMLLEHEETLGKTVRLVRTKAMLANSESKSCEYVGDFKKSLQSLQNHIQNADRLALPHLRVMYVRTLLLSKVNGNREKMIEAWGKLSEKEQGLVEEYLNKNVQQNSGSINSMRLWVQFVRYSGIDISIEEIKSRLKMLYKSSDNYPMTKLEAAFNLYILNLFELIRDNDLLNNRKRDEIRQWVDACRPLSSSDKYPFEWLVTLDGIQGIVSSKNRPELNNLVRVNGTITEIKSNTQGTIRLDCGYDVFFSPASGNFIQGKDETTRVSMVLAFRHEGPAAYEVVRLVKDGYETIGVSRNEIADDLAITEVETIEIDEPVTPSTEVLTEKPKVTGPKLNVIGKIDLEQFKKYERSPKKNDKR